MLICSFELHKKVSLIKKCDQQISFRQMEKFKVKFVKMFYAVGREQKEQSKKQKRIQKVSREAKENQKSIKRSKRESIVRLG